MLNINKMNNSRWIKWIIPFVVTCALGSCQQKGKLLKEGDWRGVPFTAKYGKFPRFAVSPENPEVSLNGTWDMVIGSGDQADKTVGIFEQKAS